MFSHGKGLFNAVEYIPPAEEPDEEYPLLLTTGRILYHFQTGTMSRRVDGSTPSAQTGSWRSSPTIRRR